MTQDLDLALYEEMQDKSLEGQLRYYRDWINKHQADYEFAKMQIASNDHAREYRNAVADALDRLRGFAPGKDGDSKAVYAVAQAVLILGKAEQPYHTSTTYERNLDRYQKLVQVKEAKKGE